MSPLPARTVNVPSATLQPAAWSDAFAETHSRRSFPSNSTIASDGAASGEAGTTRLGSGAHTSVALGSGCRGSLADAGRSIPNVASATPKFAIIARPMIKRQAG
ncbi:hypothetical protein MasN3_29260 [Massilia varians]|uniref:Uncharacterized protein n=1 Tax=Massilia varians TaxID=457921 RepID=A0ABM8C850_9BURK|nr:hypothetical protein MasN3_29260 [Massilia varians]